MNFCEIKRAKKYLSRYKPEENGPKYLEALIVVKGHAWCMDVKSERRKMVRLILNNLQFQKKINDAHMGRRASVPKSSVPNRKQDPHLRS